MKSKAETFLGFAIKAKKFRSGENTLATVKKIHLIILCRTASQNALKHAEKYAKKHRCKVFCTENKDLSELAHKDGIKIAAITDYSLAKAIETNAFPDLKELTVSGKRENSAEEIKA